MVVRMFADGKCEKKTCVDQKLETMIATDTLKASNHFPQTTLCLFGHLFSSSDSDDQLVALPFPGVFGRHLVKAPVEWSWDHAATMDVEDLDRILQQYIESCCRRNLTQSKNQWSIPRRFENQTFDGEQTDFSDSDDLDEENESEYDDDDLEDERDAVSGDDDVERDEEVDVSDEEVFADAS